MGLIKKQIPALFIGAIIGAAITFPITMLWDLYKDNLDEKSKREISLTSLGNELQTNNLWLENNISNLARNTMPDAVGNLMIHYPMLKQQTDSR